MKDYIKYIRSIVGHKEIMAIGLSAFIINEKEEVLLELRSDNHMLSFPGGSLNLGENIKDGLIREVYEETGLKFNYDDLKFFGSYSGEKGRFDYPNGDITYYTDFVFIIRVNTKNIKINPLDNESLEIKFYKFEDIDLNNMPTYSKDVLTDYYINKINEPFIK